jgi:hypothetical protein
VLFLPERYSGESERGEEWKEELHETWNGDGPSVNSEDNDYVFYKCVTEVNHLCVAEQVSDIIANILNQHGYSSA